MSTEQLPTATLASLLAAEIECQVYEEHVYPALRRLRIDGMTPAGFPELKGLERYLKDTLDVGTASEGVVARTALIDLRAAIAADRALREGDGQVYAWRYSRNGGKTWHVTAEGDPTDIMPDTGGVVIPLVAATDASQAEQAAMYRDALCDAAYVAGARAGFNAAASPDPEALNKLIATRAGYIPVLKAGRTAMAAAKGDAS